MAKILEFNQTVSSRPANALAESMDMPLTRSYSLDITTYPGGYLEFTANSVRTDGKSLYEIAADLEKIASIIRSDVMTKAN